MSQHTTKRLRNGKVLFGAWIDAGQRAQLRELARQRDRSASSVVRIAIARELERREKERTP